MKKLKTLFKINQSLTHHRSFLLCLTDNFKEVRDTIDGMYYEVEEYIGDPHFENLFHEKFHDAFWQLYVTWAFLKNGRSRLRKPRSIGPDIILEDGTIIEAVNVNPGEGDNRPYSAFDSGIDDSGARVVQDPDPKIILRITSAIVSKKEQHKKWVQKGIVSPSQPFVIAVNAGIVSPDVLIEPSYGAKTVYAIGSLFLIMPRDPETLLPNPDKVFSRLQYLPKQTKDNGSLVKTDLFLTREYEEVSGLLFSPSHFFMIVRNGLMNDLEYIPNGFAKNVLPKEILAGIQRTWVEIEGGLRYKYFHEDHRERKLH